MASIEVVLADPEISVIHLRSDVELQYLDKLKMIENDRVEQFRHHM